MKNDGFSLLEIILYAALATIFVSVGLRAGYSLVEQGYQIQEEALTNMEIQFITYKMNDELQQAESIDFPVVGQDGHELKIKDKDGHNLSIWLQDQQLLIKRNNEERSLSTDRIEVGRFDVSSQEVNGVFVTSLSLSLSGQEFRFVRYD
ncbi:MAG: hypothetical protein IT410_01395 [Candidatus Doudnabacteria bacterium]|nr:hypothetical protein [Candidatus Doudnabacteria bacterium]